MRWVVGCVAVVTLTGGLLAAGALPVSATTTSSLPHVAVGGFSTPNGAGFALVFADGSVRPGASGDAFSRPLNAAMTGAAGVPTGGGYWEVAADGGVFGYGGAQFYGSMGSARLNQPVFSMAPTKSGKGYWLVARDGGIFSFGDARFFGSAGNLVLNQPIVGITTSTTGRGYRLAARDGGIFGYGDAAFQGSLPGRGVHATDVVGMAPTPTGNGYWIARGNGQVYAFGDAHALGSGAPSSCDAITAIVANPKAQGYRLVTTSGATVAFGRAPGGTRPTGVARRCGQVTARLELPATTMVAGSTMPAYLVVDNDTGAPLSLFDKCTPKIVIGLGNAKIPNLPVITTECGLRPLVFPAGETQFQLSITARYVTWTGPCSPCPPPLPPDIYYARVGVGDPGFPAIAPVAVHVVPPRI
jgi:hypothetical protein